MGYLVLAIFFLVCGLGIVVGAVSLSKAVKKNKDYDVVNEEKDEEDK